jgi:hypothetical protein
MKYKHAIVISRSVDRKDSSLVVRLSEMDKPDINWKNEETAKATAKAWDESFKEYPARDINEWWNFMGTMIAKRDPQFKTERAFSEILRNEGVSIDPSKVGVQEKYCLIKCVTHNDCDKAEECLHPKQYAVLL